MLTYDTGAGLGM